MRVFFILALTCLLGSCTSKLVEAGGYSEVKLSGIASLRLPAQFLPIQQPVAAIRPQLGFDFLGDVAGEPTDQNFWAVTHAFAFRETRTPAGLPVLPAMLVVSRVANTQSFASAQRYYEASVRYSSDPRWSTPLRLEWKSRQVSKNLSTFEAELVPGKLGAAVMVMVDRESLIQALLLGERSVLEAEVARQVLTDLRSGFRLEKPLDDYFHKVNQSVQASADLRRKNYLALLEILQKEELDYTPTPRVVVFNANLAGQFWWPLFDRSGVPSHFAIAGRLGNLKKTEPAVWQRLEALFPNMRLVTAEQEAEKWQLKSLSGAGAISTRTASLLLDTRWAAQSDNNAKQAFATLEFPFTSEPPNLSDWLNALEAVGKQALSQGLVSLDDPR
jgi:hypothetical protein